MDFLLEYGLPLALAVIMFSLGVGLTVADFARVVKTPKALIVGAAAQLIALPATAFLLLQLLPLEGTVALGVMILAFCPGGVTTNLMTRLARGTVALSISLTAIISLTTAVTLPILLALSARYFEGSAAPTINVTSLALTMFLLTSLPVALGMAVRAGMAGLADQLETPLFKLSGGLFLIVILGALIANWELFTANLLTLGPLLLLLNMAMLSLGLGLSSAAGLKEGDSIAIAIEAGVQNGAIGVTVAALLGGEAATAHSLASGVYGITMYIVTIPVIFMFLRRSTTAGAPFSR